MDAKTCIKKLQLINSVSMATVDEDNNPQVRTIGIMHTEDEKVYFLTARGKPFHNELICTRKVAILGLSRFKETIRINGIPEILPKSEQKNWLDKLFIENPYMNNVYPDNSRYILDVFCVQNGVIEYFNLGARPIFRESYTIGNGFHQNNGYCILDSCIGCGKCAKICPQNCIFSGVPYKIEANNCLHCGLCFEQCPVSAIEKPMKVGIYNGKL